VRNKTYIENIKNFYDKYHSSMVPDNHYQHTIEPNYLGVLLKPINDDPESFRGKAALDFGCGCGRNLVNLAEYNLFSRIDGVDSSKHNAKYSKEYFDSFNFDAHCETWDTDVYTLSNTQNKLYDFIMSHQVFQQSHC
jgi:2-polyprenyl-3-methyl-5-hydroxy-6-metoxy-1,4-benzoquinol methylase